MIKDEWPLPWRAQRFGTAEMLSPAAPGESGPYRALRDAGAVIVGVGNMHEAGAEQHRQHLRLRPRPQPLGHRALPGRLLERPRRRGRRRACAGGSIGADGIGSIRFPAAYCGLTGLKPTFGRSAMDGHHMAGVTTMIVSGPLCADAADCRLLGSALFGEELAAGANRPACGSASLDGDVVAEDVAPEVREACEAAIEELREASGGEVRKIEIGDLDASALAAVIIANAEGLGGVTPQQLNELNPELTPIHRGFAKYRMLLPAAAAAKSARVRTAMRRRLAALFEDVDVLAWPTVPAVAPPLEAPLVELPSGTVTADEANVRGAALANLTGIPAISVPVGLSGDGLPIGLQLQAAWGRTSCCSTRRRRSSGRTGGAGSSRCRRSPPSRPRPSVGDSRRAPRTRLRRGDRCRERSAKFAVSGAVEIAERVLRQNWREGERDGRRFAYTQPSPGRYPWQWYWDSCFAAIAWRRFDRRRARRELESLLAAQRPDGFVGHTIFWDRSVSLLRLPFYNVLSRSAFQTETIQPPLLAWAWRIAVGDPAEEPRIAAQIEWLAANRDLEGDGLLWIVQPDESGLDASPKFDPIWGWRANSRIGFPLLVRRNRSLGFDARRVRERGGPVLCEVVVNTLWSLSLQAMGRPSATPALVERLWDEQLGAFVDEAQPGGVRPAGPDLRVAGAAGPARPARGDRQAPGRGAPAEPERVPDPGRAALGRRLRALLRTGRRPRPDPPLLARADLGQHRLARLDRAAATGIRRRRARAGGGPDRRGRARRAARVLRPPRRHRPGRPGLRLVVPHRRAADPIEDK